MSNPNKQDREGWLRGDEPGAQADEFARHAAQGRKELGTEEEARGLLDELDGLIAARFGAVPSSDSVSSASPQREASFGAAAGAGEVLESKPPAKVRRLGRWYVAAAAILLLLAVGTWWLGQQNSFDEEAVFAEAFSPYANELSGRTMGDDTTAIIGGKLGEALLAYDRRDYPAAVSAFEAYSLAPSTDGAPASAPQIQLYYGISLLGANQAHAAQPVLEALRDHPTYGPPASWYRALALLRTGETDAARTALQAISNDTNSPFQARALALLPSL